LATFRSDHRPPPKDPLVEEDLSMFRWARRALPTLLASLE
jgi:hypothetical protein